MSLTRNNHYVPQWYQRGFFNANNQLQYLVLKPKIHTLPNGETKSVEKKKWYPTSKCFFQKDLYTTFFGNQINDEIEKHLFGHIDDIGSRAVKAFISEDQREWHKNFQNLFEYLDSQKIRTPKGLDWLKKNYSNLDQTELMSEMQRISGINCRLWAESVREIVSAKDSNVKFIISDHPVTVYNYACPPDSDKTRYPDDPDIALKATQTIYPLDKDYCLILTNLEYAQNRDGIDPLEMRTNPARFRETFVNTIEFIRKRILTEDDVIKINYIIKRRAKEAIAAGSDDWLYPEKRIECNWAELRHILLPSNDELFRFGGEIFVQYENGKTRYQDAYGRSSGHLDFLDKKIDEKKIGRNDPCGCGSGRKYKHCCKDTPKKQRTTWKVLSIKERNLGLYRAIYDILGLNKGKTWEDVRRDISSEQISDIYGFFGHIWPNETEIYELLPKPDSKFRGLYTGIVDARTIGSVALNASAYFDELLIQNPLMNPNNIVPEISPVKSPDKYLYQALKDIYFLLSIEPLVISGDINLIPDPYNFDMYLYHEMLTMARLRANNVVLNVYDEYIFSSLYAEDLLNSHYSMPINTRLQVIRELFPEYSTEHLEVLIDEFDRNAGLSPLVLLKERELTDGGLFMLHSFIPNYEMSLFIAQVTGSVIITDSPSRWQELQNAAHRELGVASHPWESLCKAFNTIPLYDDLDMILNNKYKKEFMELRKILGLINTTVKSGNTNKENTNNLTNMLIERLKQICESNTQNDGIKKYSTKVTASMPLGGFADNHVQRLLLKSNSQYHLNSVSSVFYISPEGFF
ncbi:MAG: DUF4238 domain-containing protein [Deferribacterales bacterium]